MYVATIYQQSATPLTAPVATASTYNFATNTLTPPAGWSVNQPATSTTPTYACDYTFSGIAGSTVTGTGSWGPVYLEAVNGSPGSNGEYRAVIELYLNSATAPTAPTSVPYTFTGNVVGTINGGTTGWNATQPASSSTTPTYVTKALASTTTPGTAVSLTSWSTPVIIAQNGAPGASPTVYQLSLSADVVKQNAVSGYTPSNIVIAAKQTTGSTAAQDYSGTFKIYEDNVQVFASTVNSTQITWTPRNSKQIKIELYADTTFTQVLDTEIIPVLSSGISAVLTNDSHVLSANSAGDVQTYTGAETEAKIYVDGTDDSNNWQFYVSNLSNCTYQDSFETNTARSGVGKIAGNLGGENLIFPSVPQNTDWSPNGGPAGTNNFGYAPDGTQTSYRTAAAASIIYKGFTTSPNTTYTYSVFLKTDLVSPIRLYVDGTFGSNAVFASSAVNFTNITEALKGVYSLSGTGAVSASAITIGNGWYRLSFTFTTIITPAASGTVNVHIYPITANEQQWWGAQVNRNSQPLVYTPTTTASISKLIGIDTVNLLLYPLSIVSNAYTSSPGGSNGLWRYSIQYTLTAVNSPVNTSNAVLLTHNTTGLTGSTIFTNRNIFAAIPAASISTTAPTGPITYSVYVKAHTSTTNAIFAISFNTIVGAGVESVTIGYNFNFQTQAFIADNTNNHSTNVPTRISNLSNVVESVGDGWYRLSMTFSVVNGLDPLTAPRVIISTGNDSTKVLSNSGAAAYSSTAGTGIIFWNPQIYTGTLRGVPKRRYVQVTGLSQDSGFIDIDAYNVNLNQTFTQRFSLSKSKFGVNAVSGYLTNEAHTIPADISGTVASGDYTAAGGTFKVFNGTTDVTNSSTFQVVGTPTGIAAAIDTSTGVYTLDEMTVDTTTVTFRATYGTTTIDKVYSITKSKSGSSGQRGNVTAESATTQTSWTTTASQEATNYFTTNYSGTVLNDRITLYNTGAGFTQTRYWDGSAWIQAAAVVDGNLVVTGTITGDKLAANTITANKIKVGGAGTALNDDPMFLDSTAWQLGANTSFASGTTLNTAVGTSYISSGVGTDNITYSAKKYPIGPGKRYRLSANLYAQGGNARNMYLLVQFYDYNDNYVGSTQTGWGGTMSGYTFGGLTPVDTWTRQGGQFGTGTGRPIPDSVRYVQIGVWFQYSGHPEGTPIVQQACQDLRLEELITGELIIDGTLSASKIQAGTTISDAIFAGTLDANNITVLGSRVVTSGGFRGQANGFVLSDSYFTLTGGTSPVISRPVDLPVTDGSSPLSASGGQPIIYVGHVDIYFYTDSATNPEFFSFDATFSDHPYDGGITDIIPSVTGRITKFGNLRRVNSSWWYSTTGLGGTVRIPFSQWVTDSNDVVYLNTRFALWDNRFTKNTTSGATCEVLYNVSATGYVFNI